MTNWRRIWSSHWTDFAIVMLIGVGIIRVVMSLPGQEFKNDFAHFYASSRLWLQGEPVYRADLEPQFEEYGFEYDPRIFKATNPPLLVILFVPFACLSPKGAFIAWALFQAFCLAIMLAVTGKLLRPELSRRGWWLIVALTLVSNPVFYHFYFSQVQFLLGAAIYGALLLSSRGRALAACLLVTAIGMLKLFPFVLLPWFVLRDAKDLKTVVIRGASCVALMIGLFAVSGISAWVDFVTIGIPAIASGVLNQSLNFSIPTFIGNLGFAWFDFEPTPFQASVCRKIGAVTGLAVIAAAYAAAFFWVKRREAQFSILCIAMLLAGATCWAHYLVLLILPLALVALHLAANPSFLKNNLYVTSLIALLFVFAPIVSTPDAPILSVLMHYFPLYAMLVLAVLCLETESARAPEVAQQTSDVVNPSRA